MSGPGPGSAPARRAPRALDWRASLPAAALALLGLLLYGRGLLLGFVGDDFTLLDAALRQPLGELLSGRHGIVGYYRPVSRELYFWWWGKVVGLGPGGFHLVNAMTFAAVVLLIDRLGREWAGPRAGRLAAAAFVLFPPGSALTAWVSCAQDLIALFWAVLALLLYRRHRHAAAGLAVALAALSKETALVLPAALAVMDAQLHRRARWRERLARLAPALGGLLVAVAAGVAARATWPAGTAVAVWSPGQLVSAWRLPLDFARTLIPPGTGAGIARTLGSQPAWLALVAAMAALAVPPTRPARARAPARASGPPAPAARPVLVFGLALLLLAMLPVGFVADRWRGYFFSLSGVGAGLAAGVLLARLPAAAARALLALGALVNFGAGGFYQAVEASWGPARHPHVNYAFFRDTGALTGRMLAALEPWCPSLRSLPRTFAAGLPPDPVFESVLGPGLRVTCRDTVTRVRFLAEFTPADAGTDFGVLRFDPAGVRFVHERADARVRARVGEGFLVHARYDVAAACFEAAAAAGPPDPELSYPLATALAAAGRGSEAMARWRSAQAAGALPDPAAMAARLSGGDPPGPRAEAAAPAPRANSEGPALERLLAAALRAPWEAEPHRALGRSLLERGRAREATLELAVAAGISREMSDLARLGQGYEAMGAVDQALSAYQQALTAGLGPDLYDLTRDRYLRLMREQRPALDQLRSGP